MPGSYLWLFPEVEAFIPQHKSQIFNKETAWPSKGACKVAPGIS